MSHSIEWIANDAIVRLSGDITLSEIYDIAVIINSDDRFLHMKYRIYEFNHVNTFIPNENEMANLVEIGERSTSWNKELRIGIVSQDIKIFELVKEYAKRMKLSDWEIKMFPKIQEAMDWCKS